VWGAPEKVSSREVRKKGMPWRGKKREEREGGEGKKLCLWSWEKRGGKRGKKNY